MRVSQPNWLLLVFLSLLFALLFSGCGVFEVGIEKTSTPVPPVVTVIEPTIPQPIPTLAFGLLKPGQIVKIIQLDMLDSKRGWAVGQVETDLTDHILFTEDGGQTWQERSPRQVIAGQPADGLSVKAFFDAQGNAWAGYASPQGGQPAQGVWRSTDEGRTWQQGQGFDLSGIQMGFFSLGSIGFLDAQHGWALAHLGAGMSHDYVAIFTTADAGQSWQRVVDPQKTSELMPCGKTGLAFSTPLRGWLTGDCPGLLPGLFLYATTDGGQSWQQTALMAPKGQPENFLTQGNPGCGIPVLVYSTARATFFTVRCLMGAEMEPVTWLYSGLENDPLTALALPLPFGSLHFINPQEGWLVGSEKNDLSAPGAIYHTADGGLTWDLMTETAWQGRADFVDAQTGWVIAQSADKLALVKTTDGGTTWEALIPKVAP